MDRTLPVRPASVQLRMQARTVVKESDGVIPTWSGLLWSRYHDMAVITAEEKLFEAADGLDEGVLEEHGYMIGKDGDAGEILASLCALIEGSIGYGLARGWDVDGAVEAFIKGERRMEKYL